MAGNTGNIKVRIDNVRKVYHGRNGEMIALNGVNMDIMENEFICVVGPSGKAYAGILETPEIREKPFVFYRKCIPFNGNRKGADTASAAGKKSTGNC